MLGHRFLRKKTPMLLKLTQTSKGRGLEAVCDIKAGTVVEVSPIILIPRAAEKALEVAEIDGYPFIWSDTHLALAMGLGSFFNHAYEPNIKFEFSVPEQEISFRATKDIQQGEEVCINYNGDWGNEYPLWFEVK